ncbi:MAG: pyrroloquinoline quinone-dependent dehydrogenase [Halioglobus sp.]|nr:pyrroloquinoline quinone-dependent dehydrogenase [Halioglobus sp.]
MSGTDALLMRVMYRFVLPAVLLCTAPAGAAQPVSGWPVYGGDHGGSRFSSLARITTDNVDELEVAWVYRTGDSSELRPDAVPSSFLATPVLRDNTLYFCSGLSRAFAVDAETGEERWVFDAEPDMSGGGTGKCRGVALWQDEGGPRQRPCLTRVFMGTLDGRLAAIDAATGAACDDFGEAGFVDLRAGMGEIHGNEMAMTSPPVVAGDMVIQGAHVVDNRRVESPPGVIRAWDARTGELRWAFDPVPPGAPSPQEVGAPPEQRYHTGTPNAWSILSVDPERGLVFVPFGSPGINHLGGHRRRHGFDYGYYANSVVALRADTGEVVWRFQAVHHDLWDYDVAFQPVLIDIEKDGESVPALVQATKMGHLFILDRRTGEPLYPVEERPVPQTNVPGEYTSPTQPFPTFPPPLHPHKLSPDDAWGLTFYDRADCRAKIAAARNEGIFTPPALDEYSIQYPGVAGGQNWGSLAYDAPNNALVMPQNHVVTYNRVIRRGDKPDGTRYDEAGGYSNNAGSPYAMEHGLLFSVFGIPCVAPPWGTLLSVSLDTGEVVWKTPLGTPRDMVPGLSWFPYFPAMGFPSAGGPLVTAGGLVFIGASLDNYIRAFDAATGEELWRGRLPAGAQATPMTYRGEHSGKQFVVIAAGGHSYMRTTLGDTLFAFTLAD